MKRLIFVLVTLVVIAVLTCAPALAAAPYRESAPAVEDFPFAKLCPDLDFNYHLDMMTEGTRTENGDGTFRWAIKVTGTGRFYTTAKSVPIVIRVNWQVVTSTGDYPPAHNYYNVLSGKRTGNMRVDLPGGAHIYLEAGQMTFGPGGQHFMGNFPGLGDVPLLCAALR